MGVLEAEIRRSSPRGSLDPHAPQNTARGREGGHQGTKRYKILFEGTAGFRIQRNQHFRGLQVVQMELDQVTTIPEAQDQEFHWD